MHLQHLNQSLRRNSGNFTCNMVKIAYPAKLILCRCMVFLQNKTIKLFNVKVAICHLKNLCEIFFQFG